MAKKNNLAALQAAVDVTAAGAWSPAPEAVPAAPAARPVSEGRKAATREGTANVSAHLPARYQRDLKRLAADSGDKVQDLIAEALDDLFRKRKFPTSSGPHRE